MDDDTRDTPTVSSALSGVGGVLAGRYELRARLGRGATKEVYLAYDPQLDREVALAIVVGAGDDVARARVAREAQVTGRLGDHPNIITVYDSGVLDGVPYLVMRAMSGGSVADLLARERPPLERTIRLGREVALALAHAHAHGVVHRDVKPDNVWLAADGSAALGDFGIAHRVGSDRLTAEGMVLGTVRYLSPEQIRGVDVGPASDLYALGVTLYELVTGRAPFVADDPMQVLTQHLTTAPVAPSEHDPRVPPALERLILELLAKLPQQRPTSAADVAVALAGMAPGGDAASATRVAPTVVGLRPTQSRRFVSVLAAGADIDDPEALHSVFERASAAIERHGGTIERYLGDALVGFFGLDGSHGDDTLRAARAALELCDEAPQLRLGIEAGELFLGSGPRGAVATGSAIKSAGKLAEQASAGEILLGERARRTIARDASIDAKTGRLLELRTEQPALLRASETPFVGRGPQLDELRAAFARARDERTCRLVTVAGAPGIGKSRLAREFLAEVRADATVLAGRCLAYGEGTTYRALADIVRGLGGDTRRRIEQLLAGDELAFRGVLGAIGLSDAAAQAEETSWGMRRLLEQLARERPLVVAVEDIHWAEPALLELLDHLVALSSGSPILLVCLTRPELLESRPEWAAPQPNRSMIVLDALDGAQARELAQRLGAGELAGPIADRAEGNPLFVEQLVAVDAGHDGELPASIHSVLATRIDALEAGERIVLQRAAVEGRTFHAGALRSLLPEHERGAVSAFLVALARKGLIGADRSEFPGQDAFRFTHALIREAAYGAVPKLLRAELHAGVARWLDERAADEIVGFHLERACLLRRELGEANERERALGVRAAARLEAAARTALARGDAAAGSALLERAVAVVGPDAAARGALLPALGASLFEAKRPTDATRVLDEAIAQAPAPGLEARARLEREFVRLETETTASIEQSRLVADAVLPLLEHDGDDSGTGRAWSLRAQVAWIGGRVGEADAAWCEAAEWARRARDERELFDVLRWRATAAVLGPTPVDEAIGLCDEFRATVAASPAATAWTFNALAVLHAMRGEASRAERYVLDANETLDQLGGLTTSVSHHEALVRLLAGQPELAELTLRGGVERLSSLGDGGLLATTTAMLAQAVYAQGRVREADELCDATAQTAPNDDTITQVIWRGVKAKTLAARGRFEEGEALAREAIALVEPTDLLSHHGDALLDLAEVLRASARAGEARGAVDAALALYDAKGNAVAAGRARAISDLAPGAAGGG
jgi:tetratricopeptide (TPR) repeat protein